MHLQVSKWGNSLAIRLPAQYTKQFGIARGDYLDATMSPDGEMRIAPSRGVQDKSEMLRKVSLLHESLPQTTSIMNLLREEARY